MWVGVVGGCGVGVGGWGWFMGWGRRWVVVVVVCVGGVVRDVELLFVWR